MGELEQSSSHVLNAAVASLQDSKALSFPRVKRGLSSLTLTIQVRRSCCSTGNYRIHVTCINTESKRRHVVGKAEKAIEGALGIYQGPAAVAP
jgi:hypothetical protein